MTFSSDEKGIHLLIDTLLDGPIKENLPFIYVEKNGSRTDLSSLSLGYSKNKEEFFVGLRTFQDTINGYHNYSFCLFSSDLSKIEYSEDSHEIRWKD